MLPVSIIQALKMNLHKRVIFYEEKIALFMSECPCSERRPESFITLTY